MSLQLSVSFLGVRPLQIFAGVKGDQFVATLDNAQEIHEDVAEDSPVSGCAGKT